MTLLGPFRGWALSIWNAPEGVSRSLRLEQRFVALRWVAIFILVPVLPLLHLSPRRMAAAGLLVGIVSIYNSLVHLLIRRKPSWIANGYVTTLGDSLFNIAIVNIAGGFSSPLYVSFYTVTVSAAMRYGYGPSLAVAFSFASFDALATLRENSDFDAVFVIRTGFLCLTALLAGYQCELAQQAESALQERLRQANLLNLASATLGASLELEPVLRAVTAAAAHLFNSPYAVLQPAPAMDGGTELPPSLAYPEETYTQLHEDLELVCRQYSAAGQWGFQNGQQFGPHHLPSGYEAIVLVLAIPTRRVSLATLALAAPLGMPAPKLDPDVRASFVERMTLAIENALLYRTLASRGDDLQRAYAELAAAHQQLLSVNELKTSFLANVSHELRTPLSSIRSFSELLLTYDDATVRQEFLQIINSESERLTRLVNDVLDVTKIEAGHMDWRMATLDLEALLKETARTYSTLIESHRLRLEEEIEPGLPPLYGDRDRLQQVIGNLLNNAVKFTPSGSIALGARRVGQEVHVYVRDTGIGIAPEDQERIFEKFQQVGPTLTGKPAGTGLGLAICRDIVQHHGGRLWVESTAGGGSTFLVSLPIETAAVQPAIQPRTLAVAH